MPGPGFECEMTFRMGDETYRKKIQTSGPALAALSVSDQIEEFEFLLVKAFVEVRRDHNYLTDRKIGEAAA